MARSNRTFPELVNIKDKATHESLRQNWQQTYDHRENLDALSARISTLESTVADLQSSIADLQEQITHALTQASGS